ncbi:MAG: aspartate aminotransferase family protein [Bacteroidetes bacterium]|nr:aspartate aminotransferase family protein [Bacteroidota bacterium]
MTNRELFYKFLAQTSDSPLAIEVSRAEGVYLYGPNDEKYIDLISGIAVSNVGHRHPHVVKAIKEQLDKHMHLMVYGEFIQTPQVKLAELLTSNLPEKLNSVYLVNSGSEAVEGALKLSKRYTGRTEIVCFKNAYHGSSHGALSVMGDERMKNAFRPLLPDVRILEFNNIEMLNQISTNTACVIVEPIQGEAGVIVPDIEFIKKLRNICSAKGVLLIFDEIQTGFGRTVSLWAFEQFDVVPDILLLAKGMGGGLPIGAFISSKEIMNSLTNNPVLGHITTFGGNPVCAAAALANLEVIIDNKLWQKALMIENVCKELLIHPKIKNIRGRGALLAIEFEDFNENKKVIDSCLKNGLITDWFLFADNCMRIAPPLIITEEQLREACKIIIDSI